MTLISSGDESGGKTCSGSGGYSDIDEGTSVTVYDAEDTRVGLGQLRVGKVVVGEGSCTFKFVVNDVPANGSLFSVEVGHRGKVTFKKSDAKDVVLSLGD